MKARVTKRSVAATGRKSAAITKKATTKRAATAKVESPSRLIDARIRELGDWRGETLAQVRALIRQAVPDVVEEWKWRGVPVWYRDGMICTGETYKSVVKVTFAKGARSRTPPVSSTPASKGTSGARSISMRARRSMRLRSRR